MSNSRLGRAAIAAVALSLAATTSAAAADLRGSSTIRTFSNPGTSSIPGGWAAAPVGDVNGDGIDDLATGNGRVILGSRPQQNVDITQDSARVRVLRPSGSVPVDTVQAAGDVDADGIDDLLVTADNPYVVYGSRTLADTTLTPGAGVMMLATGFTGLTEPAAAIGDFDGDGYDDLGSYRGTNTTFGAITRGGPRLPTIQVGTAQARVIQINPTSVCSFSWWTLRTICNYGGSFPVAAGDINGDGKGDILTGFTDTLVYGRTGNAAINVANLGTAATRFRKPGGATWAGVLPDPTPVGDVNGDGYDDLKLKLWNPPASDRFASILLGGPALGTDIDMTTVKTVDLRWPGAGYQGAVSRAVGDLDGDGADDLVVSTFTDNIRGQHQVRVVPRMPSTPGTVVDVTQFPEIDGLPGTENGASMMGGADFDGDAKPDLYAPDGGTLGNSGRWSGVRLITRGSDQAAPQLAPIIGVFPQDESRITPQSFQPGTAAGQGTDLRLQLLEPATVKLTYRRADGSVAGSDDRAFPTGTTTIRWDGRVGGAALPAGSYTLVATPRDASGNQGEPLALPFTISGGTTPPPADPTVRVSLAVSDPGNIVAPGYSATVFVSCEQPTLVARNVVDGGPAVQATSEESVKISEGAACRTDVLPADTSGLYGCSTVSWSAVINGVATPFQFGFYPVFRAQAGVNTLQFQVACGAPSSGLAKFANGWSRYGDLYSWGENTATLTAALASKTSGIYSPAPIDPNGKTIQFSADLRGGAGGGEGLALVFLTASGGQPASGKFLGTGGSTLGFGGLSGTAVALDTRQDAGEASSNYVGVSNGTSGTSMNYVQTADPGVRLRGGIINVKVVSKAGKLSVYVNDKLRIDRALALPPSAYIGFVAANGVGVQPHVVSALTMTTS